MSATTFWMYSKEKVRLVSGKRLPPLRSDFVRERGKLVLRGIGVAEQGFEPELPGVRGGVEAP